MYNFDPKMTKIDINLIHKTENQIKKYHKFWSKRSEFV